MCVIWLVIVWHSCRSNFQPTTKPPTLPARLSLIGSALYSFPSVARFLERPLRRLHFKVCYICLLHASRLTSPFLIFSSFARTRVTSGWWRRNERWVETVVTPSLQMTNEVLKCDWPFRAAQHPYLFCHLCLKLSPTGCNGSLNTWPEQSPAGGGVYPPNVKWNNLVCQDGQMREARSWLILCLCVCVRLQYCIHQTVSLATTPYFRPLLYLIIYHIIKEQDKS